MPLLAPRRRQARHVVERGVELRDVVQKLAPGPADEAGTQEGEEPAQLSGLVPAVGSLALLVGGKHPSLQVVSKPDRYGAVPHHGAVAAGEAVAGRGLGLPLRNVLPLVHRLGDVAAQAHAGTGAAVGVAAEGVVVAVPVPEVEALAQVDAVEGPAAEERVCDAEGHCAVVRPLPRPEVEAVVAGGLPEVVLAHRGELCGAVPHRRELQRRTERIPHRVAQDAAHAAVQRLHFRIGGNGQARRGGLLPLLHGSCCSAGAPGPCKSLCTGGEPLRLPPQDAVGRKCIASWTFL
mmetsp:Transcript_77796/g.228061  ORF Transcript_77796/g.228061 Transcript_77796/m.228061 type:complete len:292 (-) Transcript_77796:160-1035(-)